MTVFQKSDWAIDIVNEVYAQFAHSPLAGMPVAVAELKKVGIESRPEVAYILRKSQFAEIPELNLANTLTLFG
jgi:hypothetical protein